MFKEFNVKFEDVEMIGGADNILEGTEVTKVIVRGDSKMSSLDSAFKNCSQLDTIDGQIDLDGVTDIDNILENSEFVKKISLKNINNEEISANNSFPNIEEISIGGELYAKAAIQNVVASKDWTFDNIKYVDTIGKKVYEKSGEAIDENDIVINDPLEQKATEFEIIGQTYENLTDGKGEQVLIDELIVEAIDGNPTEFSPHIEQPICVESIEGETYQNLVDGKGEHKLTDPYNATWTESNNKIENPSSMIEISEIWGNTIQGYTNVVTEKMIYDSINNSSVATKVTMNSDGSLKVDNWAALNTWTPTEEDMEKYSIKLKPNTTYSMCAWRKETGQRLGSLARVEYDGYKGNHHAAYKFTTNDTGRVFLCPYGYVYNHVVRVYEGDFPDVANLYDFDQSYIQSVGDLYVDEEGTPILDEEGNEQYKLEIESDNINLNRNDIEFVLPYGKYPEVKLDNTVFKPNVTYEIVVKVISNTLDAELGDFSANHVTILTGNYISVSSGIGSTGEFRGLKTCSTDITRVNNYTFRFNTINATKGEARIRIAIYERNSLSDTPYISHETNKTTTLISQPLNKIDKYADRLYWDNDKGHYCIEQNIGKVIATPDNVSQSQYHRGPDYYTFQIKLNDMITNDSNQINSYGIAITAYANIAGKYYEYITFGGVGVTVRVSADKASNLEELKEYVKNNKLVILYRLKTPIIIDLPHLNKKPSLETYLPTTYLLSVLEVQPSKMSIINKKVIFSPELQTNKDYTLQLDSIGKNDKSITVNLGGTETTIQPVNDTNEHHKVVIRTPGTLVNNNLELSGEGVIVNDIMLFDGGENVIKQNVEYIDGIQSMGKPQEDGSYKIDILMGNEWQKIWEEM